MELNMADQSDKDLAFLIKIGQVKKDEPKATKPTTQKEDKE